MITQKWPNDLIIVRHGQSARNALKEEAKAKGLKADFHDGVRDADTPLTPIGYLQALAVGSTLLKRYPLYEHFLRHPVIKGDMIHTMYVSPYLRTRQTANQIICGMSYTPNTIIDERIRELEFGMLDGLSPEGIKAKYPEELVRKAKEGKFYYRPPGGESTADVRLRLRSFIDTIVRDCSGKNILIVCHSVVVLALRSLLEKWDENNYLQVDRENDVKNCSITTYKFDHDIYKLKLHEYNYIPYPEKV